MNDKYFTLSDVAEALGKSRPTIYDWIAAGRFPNSIEVGGSRFLSAVDVDRIKFEEAKKLIEALAALGYTCELGEATT